MKPPNYYFEKLFKIICLGILLYSFSFSSHSQTNLPVNKNFAKALENGTRTTAGIPGINYWQNKASYNISAEIIPHEKKLIGTETINYVNNSPDTLSQLVFHVFQNLYKKGNPRDFPVHPEDIHDGVIIGYLKVENVLVPDFITNGTQITTKLKNPLFPKESITIEMKWDFTIPTKSNIRMGGKDESSFFVGQWYPKVAVYDDINGWDKNIHSGGQEFYNELGDYNYSIKVPDGLMTWGTGILANAKEVLEKKIYTRYLEAHESDSIISIIGQTDYESEESLTKGNIWKFEASNVPDVAFAVSNHFLWDGTSLSGTSNKNIFIDAAYPLEAKDFTEVALIAKKTIQFLSNELPGYPYPFPAMTIFNGTNGTSGMEYPMIANDPSAEKRGRTVDVTAHEIAHNYFPFYVLTNETEHAWMDEAFAAMLPHKFQERTEPSLNRITRYTGDMNKYANTDWNIATITKSTMLKGRTSYFNLYMKPALALYFLQNILGEELFKQCMITYIDTWKEKHPTPLDFFYLINETSQQNLNWFWNSWFYDNGYPDLSIECADKKEKKYEVTIKRIGKIPVPIYLIITFEDSSTCEIHHSAAVWLDKNFIVIPVKTNKKIEKIRLGNEYIPDVDPTNNLFLIE